MAFKFACACTKSHFLSPANSASVENSLEKEGVVVLEKVIDIVDGGVGVRNKKIGVGLFLHLIIFQYPP